ncbi:MAG: hypothetical protein K2M68_07960 [Muribaculaceae bacterium]|nr:hypothetical protein [Muribaculaceae bacterium]
MNEETKKRLAADPDGLLTYEYIANHIDSCDDCIEFLIDNMIKVDLTGQFISSAARYLSAIDKNGFKPSIDRLVAAAIDKDREHRYLPDLLEGVYGADYRERAAELRAADDNFRRIEKRLNPQTSL